MSQDHQYEIILRKGELLIELCSDDDYFISKQLDKWFKSMLGAPSGGASRPQKTDVALDAPKKVNQKSLFEGEETSEQSDVSRKTVDLPISSKPVSKEAKEDLEEKELELNDSDAEEDTEEVQIKLEKPLENPKTQHHVEKMTVSFEMETEIADAKPSKILEKPVLDEAVKDDFEAVMASIKEDMEKSDEAVVEDEMPSFKVATLPPPRESKEKDSKKFDLEMVDSLQELYERSSASTPEEFLLLSSYYLTFCEALEQFSLKQINSLLIKSNLTPVNHSVVENALAKGFIEMVPDLTGMAEVTEYIITVEGGASGKSTAEKLFS